MSATEGDLTLYTRQSVLDVKIPEVVSVVGVGGIGYWVAQNAAMLGAKKIILFDPDVFENHNRNRLPISLEDIGRNKVDVAKDHIQRIRPTCLVLAMSLPVNRFNIGQLDGFVFMCTDTTTSQNDVRKYCVEKQIPFVRLGYDGRHLTIENKPSMDTVFSSEDDGEDAGRYTVVPSYAITPQIAALTGLMFCDMNLWRRFPQNSPDIHISGNIFQIGQAMLEGKIFREPMRYPDRNLSGPEFVQFDGQRVT